MVKVKVKKGKHGYGVYVGGRFQAGFSNKRGAKHFVSFVKKELKRRKKR